MNLTMKYKTKGAYLESKSLERSTVQMTKAWMKATMKRGKNK